MNGKYVEERGGDLF